jgi:hypothetical protein
MLTRMYNIGMYTFISQTGGWDADVTILLVDPAYTFDPDDAYVSDVVAFELTTTNYVRLAVVNPAVTLDNGTNSIIISADPANWPNLGPVGAPVAVGGAVIFRNVGADAACPLLSHVQLPNGTVTGGGYFRLTWGAAGVISATSP